MELFLVQHGEARSREEDPSRPLTVRGVEDVRKMAIFAARHGVSIEEIRHSGKLRARETAMILAEPLDPARGVNEVPGLNPNDDVQPLAEGLQGHDASLMLVGHLPFLSRLAGFLLAGDADAAPVRFYNAGIVCLLREEEKWTLNWSVSPDFVS